MRNRAYRIFLSHKIKDRHHAHEIKTKIETLNPKEVKVYVCEECPPGQKYREAILRRLKASDLLIFLYTSAGMQFDWCLYETGFYDAKHVDKLKVSQRRPLVVLYGRGMVVPPPLEVFENYQVDAEKPERLMDFLAWLFDGTNHGPALNKKVLHDPASKALVRDAFLAPFLAEEMPVQFDRVLTLLIAPSGIPALREEATIPDDSQVVGKFSALRLFAFNPAIITVTWKQLCGQLRALDPQSPWPGTSCLWTDHLGAILREAVSDRMPAEGLPLFYSAAEKASYRPTLFSMLKKGDGAVEFQISFTKLPTELGLRLSSQMAMLANLLDFCMMFKAVLDDAQFAELRSSDRPMDREALIQIGERFMLALNTIRVEYQNRGLAVSHIADAFGAEGEDPSGSRRRALEFFQRYVDARKRLFDAFPTGDVVKARVCFGVFSEVQREFLKMAARRYAELAERQES